MINNYEVFEIENIQERAKFIQRSNELFSNSEVLMKCDDSLTYVFNNVCEAITFIIYRVKEMGPTFGKFKQVTIRNINSPDMVIIIDTNVESYFIKSLDSYRYKEESKKDLEEKEIEYMLDFGHHKFIDDLNAKANMMKREFDTIKFEKKQNNIEHMLDRYFGNGGWIKYWFTTRPLSRISVELTLNVLLSDNCTVINVTSDKPKKSKNIKMIE